mmetsp:Transcript_45719/g.83739  ORF Transcript_45719/g.83739 Transcript_45719/m.83739 type:complete len:272 (-) Transcript_45719:65-880(-)
MASRQPPLDAVLSHSELGWTARNQAAVKQKLASVQVHNVTELKSILVDGDRLNEALRKSGHKAFSAATLQILHSVVQEALESWQLQERWRKQKQQDLEHDSEVPDNGCEKATSEGSQDLSEETSLFRGTSEEDTAEERSSAAVLMEPKADVSAVVASIESQGEELDSVIAYAEFKSPDVVKQKLVSVGITSIEGLEAALSNSSDLSTALRREGHKGLSQASVESLLAACECHRLDQRRKLQKEKLHKGAEVTEQVRDDCQALAAHLRPTEM